MPTPPTPSASATSALSLNKVGVVLREKGDLAGALDAFQASRAIESALAERLDGSNAGWQRDISGT